MRTVGAILLVVAAIALPSIGSAQKILKWKDENGVTRYGDTIPPQYANRDRDLLNNDGVRVGSVEGEVTDEEADERKAAESAAEADKSARDEIARHDKMLLATYTSVADIEHLRDQRLEQSESQIKLTELNLSHLRQRIVGLQNDADHFKPYTARPDALEIPVALALDLSQTTRSISNYEQDLASKRASHAALNKTFADDIARFIELTGGQR